MFRAFDMETVHFGVVVYGRGVLSELNIPFDFTNDKNILTAAVTAIPYDNPLPGTSFQFLQQIKVLWGLNLT